MRTIKTPLSKLLLLGILSLAVVAFTQTPVVSAKDVQTRPFYMSGQITFLWSGSIIDQGVATHFGNFTGEGSYESETYYAANGDEIYCNAVSFDTATSTGVNEFAGGTGRFEFATGSYTYIMSLVEVTEDGATFIYTGEGTITY